jgi:uncharacterized protein YbbC (DUF1343 family)
VLQEIDATMARAILEKKLPGGVVWIEQERQVWQKAFGRRNTVGRTEAATLDTLYDTASLTKVLATAPSLLILSERGKLELDTPVSKYLPAFTGDGRQGVTLRHLLTHTSGLRPGISLHGTWQGAKAAVELACQEKLQQPPGTHLIYSDINFILLGEIVRRISGKPLHEFAQAEIFAPLKMRDTGFLPAASLRPRIAPTEFVNGQLLRGTAHDPTTRRMGGIAGHAGVFSTAGDVARFARMILGGGQLDGTRILSEKNVRLMTSVQTPNSLADKRGLGWDIHSGYSSPRGNLFPVGSFGHTGFTGPSLWIDPASQSFWLLMTNRNHPNGKGAVVPLRRRLGTLAAEAVSDHRPPVLNGIDVLLRQNFEPLKGLRVGLITNHTGTDARRVPSIDLLHQSRRLDLRALFSPEHGIRGKEDVAQISDSRDPATDLPIYSLYGKTKMPLPEHLDGLDALVFDIQDIGCRFYTYIATMGNCMEAAAQANLKFFVLDRSNPVGGHLVEGPLLEDSRTFVRYHDIPVRHGMTAGELARLFNAEKALSLNLHIVPVQGWRRDSFHDATGLPWRNPSPNMRSLTQAILYPGVGLLEFCKLSVGRGTDTPFEVIGAPYIDDLHLAQVLNAKKLPGITFLPIRFTPNANKFRDQKCRGVNLVLTDREKFRATTTGLHIAKVLHRLHSSDFDLEKVNTLLGHPKILRQIRESRLDKALQTLEADRVRFHKRRRPFLLYTESKPALEDLLKIRIFGQELP